ncbi:hypothetical protein NSA50_02280 [Clostridium sp. DSM 100503]|uniref:hypothetical protein n=1 Tax=Clostridium sp. DSM 100503 TaxID=2963282 RepID=UPI00214A143D|nr:hypothetical protein [Clostridium sp. DSM 100503]MCR1949886.1 hypothetical protein [Clostridium sp. DSM 100503]
MKKIVDEKLIDEGLIDEEIINRENKSQSKEIYEETYLDNIKNFNDLSNINNLIKIDNLDDLNYINKEECKEEFYKNDKYENKTTEYIKITNEDEALKDDDENENENKVLENNNMGESNKLMKKKCKKIRVNHNEIIKKYYEGENIFKGIEVENHKNEINIDINIKYSDLINKLISKDNELNDRIDIIKEESNINVNQVNKNEIIKDEISPIEINKKKESIGELLRNKYSGVRISVLVKGLGVITGEVVLNIDSTVSIKTDEDVIIFIDEDKIVGFI